MRVLFTAVPSAGHVNPLLPLARALVATGHEVTLTSGRAAAATATTAGIGFVEAGLDESEMVAQAAARFGDLAAPIRGIAMFAAIAAPAFVRDALPQLDRLAPDLVINEEGEWGGPVLAAIAGVPAVSHGWGAPLWSDDELQAIAAAVAPLWREHNVTPSSPAGLFDRLYIDTCPPVLQSHAAARIPHRRPLRFEPFDSEEQPPAWLREPRARPLLYATLGTVPAFNVAPTLLAALAEGLGDLDVDAVVTVGMNNDPRSLRPLPPNVRAERHLSQVEVLSRSSVAITHGGAGSTLAALSFGVPLLLLPGGAPSQRRLAASCVDCGAALALDRDSASAPAIREAVQELLEDGSYRASAQRVRASICEQPTARTLVSELTKIATWADQCASPLPLHLE